MELSPTKSILIGAGVTILGSFLGQVVPFVGICISCAGFIGGGVVAVRHYTKASGTYLTTKDGLAMGAQVGAAAFAMSSFFTLLAWLGMGRPSFLDLIDRFGGLDQLPAEQLEMVETIFTSPLFILSIVLFSLLINVVFGTIGGAIGTSIYKDPNDA